MTGDVTGGGESGTPSAGDPGSVTSTVVVGGYDIEVGAPTGIAISIGRDPQAQPGERVRLSSAIAEQDPETRQGSRSSDELHPRADAVDKLERVSGHADETTEQVERADALWQGIATGQLQVSAINAELDSMLALLQKLDRSDRFEEQLRLARSLSLLLSVALRWLELLRSLRELLAAAERHGDAHARAWVLHELGTLRLAGGELKRADSALSEAAELRRRLGDRRGLAATERNLQVLCRTLRRLLREGRLVSADALERRARGRSSRRLLGRAGLLVLVGLLVAGGVLAATHGSHSPAHASHGSPTGGSHTAHHGGGSSSGPRGGGSAQSGSGTAALTVAPTHGGSVVSDPAGIDCPTSCTAAFSSGATVTLTASALGGFSFSAWSGDCNGPNPCKLTMGADHSIGVQFSRVVTTTTTPPDTTPTVTSGSGQTSTTAPTP